MSTPERDADLAAIAKQCDGAVDKILGAVGRIDAQVQRLEPSQSELAAQLKAAAREVMEACNFQDIVGQLVDRLRHGASADPLLQGPASSGAGPSQDDIDVLWKTAIPTGTD